MSVTDTLFDRVVAASRLSRAIAPFTITRLLVRAGVVPSELTREDLVAALPTLGEGLAVYLPPEEVDAALRDIEALARG